MENESFREMIEIIKRWLIEKRIGSITINFYSGGITNYTVKQSKMLGDGK